MNLPLFDIPQEKFADSPLGLQEIVERLKELDSPGTTAARVRVISQKMGLRWGEGEQQQIRRASPTVYIS